jgi:hypothetical protein
MGSEVYSQTITNSNKSTINISQLSKGVYFWEMIDNNGFEGKGKIVIIN